LPLDELYAAEPADFVATRDRLVRELRAAGDAEGARELARRRRPTAAAHTVNQLARNRPDELGAYLDLATTLRATQARAVSDEAARAELRELDRDRRARLLRLLDHAGTHRDDVERALAAALVDTDAAAAARAGELERIPESAGSFTDFGEGLPSGPRPSRATERRAATRNRDRIRQLEDEARRARADLRDAQEQLRTAERRVRDAERRVERIETERSRLDR
jgi:hypothetical protein